LAGSADTISIAFDVEDPGHPGTGLIHRLDAKLARAAVRTMVRLKPEASVRCRLICSRRLLIESLPWKRPIDRFDAAKTVARP